MLPETDPRHGRRAGYIAGCRNECCRPHHLRYQKVSSLRRLREGSQHVPATRARRRIEHWSRYGVTPNAIGVAAQIGEGTVSAVATRSLNRVLRSTERAILAVTWDDLPGNALVNADLTRARIYSLMAAGHPLTWLCEQIDGLNLGGKWRVQERVTLQLARNVQAVYDTAPAWGPSKQTASKAQRKGHGTPASWDDPHLPAMPHGWRPVIETGVKVKRRQDLDEAVVVRVLAGEKLPMSRAERLEVVTRARGMGWSEETIRARTGITKATDKTRFDTTEGAA